MCKLLSASHRFSVERFGFVLTAKSSFKLSVKTESSPFCFQVNDSFAFPDGNAADRLTHPCMRHFQIVNFDLLNLKFIRISDSPLCRAVTQNAETDLLRFFKLVLCACIENVSGLHRLYSQSAESQPANANTAKIPRNFFTLFYSPCLGKYLICR